jgi:hypothetical protein
MGRERIPTGCGRTAHSWSRVRVATCTAAVHAVLLCCPFAHAQSEITASATGSAAIAYTDNLYNAPRSSLPGQPQRRSAWFVVLTPGMAINHERARSGYTLTYTQSFFRYLTTVKADSNGDQLSAAADYQLTPIDDLSFGLSGTHSSTATLLTDPSALGRPQPDTSGTFYTAAATQDFAHAFSEEWRGIQRASFGLARETGTDLPEPWRLTTTASIGAGYGLPRDAWSFNWEVTYFHSRSAERGGQRTPRTRYLQTGPVASWRHDFNEEWASLLSAGTAMSYRPEADPRLALVPPSFAAGLDWQYDPYSAALTYSAGTDMNLYTNRIYYSDSVSLSGSWSIMPQQGVLLSTSNNLSGNRPLVSPAQVGQDADQPTVYAWMSTAMLSWGLQGLPQLALTYVHAAQLTHGDSARAVSPDFDRNQVMLSVGWQYPQVNLSRLTRSASFRVSGSGSASDTGTSKRDR